MVQFLIHEREELEARLLDAESRAQVRTLLLLLQNYGCRANMAHIRQPRPDSGFDFQVKGEAAGGGEPSPGLLSVPASDTIPPFATLQASCLFLSLRASAGESLMIARGGAHSPGLLSVPAPLRSKAVAMRVG